MKSIKCLIGIHKWTDAHGYHNSYCSRCGHWYYFHDGEDSPQGRGKKINYKEEYVKILHCPKCQHKYYKKFPEFCICGYEFGEKD